MSNRMGGGGMGPPDAQDGFVECKPAIVRKCGTGHFVKGCVHVTRKRSGPPKSLKNGDHRLVLPLCRFSNGFDCIQIQRRLRFTGGYYPIRWPFAFSFIALLVRPIGLPACGFGLCGSHDASIV
jgi:hypothetical protein